MFIEERNGVKKIKMGVYFKLNLNIFKSKRLGNILKRKDTEEKLDK